MLARVAARSLRCYSAPAKFIRSQPFSRSYAKSIGNNRPSDGDDTSDNRTINRRRKETQRVVGPIENATGSAFTASASEGESHESANAKSQGSKSRDDFETQEGQEEQNSRPLPDLTRGIPSTLDSEMAEAASAARAGTKGVNTTEDASQPATGGSGDGDLPKTAYISSIERRKNRVARYLYASFLGLSLLGTIYLGRNWENEDEEKKHPDAPSGWGFGLFYNRADARLRDILDYYNEPSFTKLLPSPDPAWERPYTLVLSLEDLLVHSEWSREHGWRMAKRPGVDYFLRYLNQYYELVIFTSVPSMIGEPIIRKLDPFRIVMWPLFREATRFKKGEYIKVEPPIHYWICKYLPLWLGFVLP